MSGKSKALKEDENVYSPDFGVSWIAEFMDDETLKWERLGTYASKKEAMQVLALSRCQGA